MKAPLAEISVIGGIIAFPEETTDAYHLLTAEMFTNEWLGNTFAVCAQLNREGMIPDVTLVENRLGKEHRMALVACVEQMPLLAGFEDYCAVVMENWRKREIQAELQRIAFEGLSSKATMECLSTIITRQRAIDQGLRDDTAVDFWGAVERCINGLIGPKTAILTGWATFDLYTGGLLKKGFYLITGRSGKGKTDFALAMALNMSLRYRVSYLSMEMPVEQLMERVIARLARVDANRLRDKNVSPQEMQRISNAVMAKKDEAKIVIDEKQRISVAELEAKILRQRPDVIFIDHIGLMKHTEKKQLWESIADTSQRIKELAMKHNVVIIGLVQENRDGENSKPKMGNLKGSDNLTNDADGIFQMHINEHPDFIAGDAWIDAEVHITKHRHGGTGKMRFHWQPQYHDWRPVEVRRS